MDSNQVEQMIRKIKEEAISDRSSGQGVDGAKSQHQSHAQAFAIEEQERKKQMLILPPEEESKNEKTDFNNIQTYAAEDEDQDITRAEIDQHEALLDGGNMKQPGQKKQQSSFSRV